MMKGVLNLRSEGELLRWKQQQKIKQLQCALFSVLQLMPSANFDTSHLCVSRQYENLVTNFVLIIIWYEIWKMFLISTCYSSWHHVTDTEIYRHFSDMQISLWLDEDKNELKNIHCFQENSYKIFSGVSWEKWSINVIRTVTDVEKPRIAKYLLLAQLVSCLILIHYFYFKLTTVVPSIEHKLKQISYGYCLLVGHGTDSVCQYWMFLSLS